MRLVTYSNLISDIMYFNGDHILRSLLQLQRSQNHKTQITYRLKPVHIGFRFTSLSWHCRTAMQQDGRVEKEERAQVQWMNTLYSFTTCPYLGTGNSIDSTAFLHDRATFTFSICSQSGLVSDNCIITVLLMFARTKTIIKYILNL